MKTFIADIIPQIQRYSKRLDNLILLTNQQWVLVDELVNSKTVYIFRSSGELLISRNGEVEKAKWEYIGNNTLLLDLKEKSYLFRHGFFDENILALKLDSKAEYAFFINETKGQAEINSISGVVEFLNLKYLKPKIQIGLETKIEIKETKKIEPATNHEVVRKKEKPIKSRREVLETNILELKNYIKASKIMMIILLIIMVVIVVISIKEIMVISIAVPILGLIALVLHRLKYLKRLLETSEKDLMNVKPEVPRDEGIVIENDSGFASQDRIKISDVKEI